MSTPVAIRFRISRTLVFSLTCMLAGPVAAEGVFNTTAQICQGITGSAGAFHTKGCLEYGTKMVGGVTPGKGGTKDANNLPIFDTVRQAVAATGGRGFDVILEMLANVNLARDLKALAMGGRVVVIGSRGTVEIDPRDTMGRDASIVGMSLFNTPDADMTAIHAALGAGLANGTLRPVIGRELPLSAAPESHVAVMSPGARGKIVLLP